MRLLSCITGISLLLGTYSTSWTYAQPQKILDPWLIRAESITYSLEEDAKQITSSDRALLLARLGVVWWKDNPDRAHAWFEKAIAELELAPDQETTTDRRRRFATTRSLLAIVASRDKKLEGRILALLEIPSDTATDADRRDNANAVADNALAMVDSNPQRAAQLGSEALRIGLGYRLARLLWELRKRDTRLSDALFDQVLAVASGTYDEEALGWLAGFAFRGESPTDERKARLLGVLAEGFLRLSPTASDQKACSLTPVVAPLLEQYARLLPQQAPLVRAGLMKCQTNTNPSQAEAGDSTRGQLLDTVDGLVKAAGNSRDQKTRDQLLLRAAELSAQEKAYERAIALLDLVSDEERRLSSGGWEGWRWSYASAAAIAERKRGNDAGMQRIIADTPASLRPFVQLSVEKELVSSGNRTRAIEILQDARKGMAASHPQWREGGYMDLVRRYLELDPTNVLDVFNDLVRAMNSEHSSDQHDASLDTYARINVLSKDELLQLFKLPASLLEIDDIGIRDAVSSIKPPVKRAAIRLNLLSGCLEQHRDFVFPNIGFGAKEKKDVQ